MKSTDNQEFAIRVNAAIESQDAAQLEEAVDEVAGYQFKEPSNDGATFPEEQMTVILQQLSNPKFWQMQGANHLLILLQFDWGTLTKSQKSTLISAIESAYGQFSDWMSCFVLSELLGKFYCNLEALTCLERLRLSSPEIPRSLLPMGLEHIVRYSEDALLREKALGALASYTADSSEKVCQEAADALARVTNVG